jgi:hypothetical protein
MYHQQEQEVVNGDYKHYYKRRHEAAMNIQCIARGKNVRDSLL